MKEIAASQNSPDTKAYNFMNVEQVIKATNPQLEEILYIAADVAIPKKNTIERCYRTDFTLKTKKEAKELIKNKHAIFSMRNKENDFFVYNEKTEELLPFKKNDYLIYEHGYFTFDGTNYISYDDNGNEI